MTNINCLNGNEEELKLKHLTYKTPIKTNKRLTVHFSDEEYQMIAVNSF